MVTIKQIAEEVGVSPTTVSNVLYGRTKKVSPEMVEKIKKLLEEYNYVPRFGLNSLTNKSSKMIGVLINTPEFFEKSPYERPFYGNIVGSLERLFREEGYYIMLCSSKDMQDVMRMILGWNVDGVISVSMPAKYYKQTREMTGKPVVSIDMDVTDIDSISDCYNITSKDVEAGKEMMHYLLKRGIEKVIFVANTKRGADFRRYQGAEMVYKEKFGKDCELKLEMLGRTYDERTELFKKLSMHRGKNTALFFSTDLNATEAIGYYNRRGIAVPDEISIVGCDDDIYARLSTPRLTSVSVDNAKKAELAVAALMDLIRGKPVKTKKQEVDVRLVERESVR